VKKFECLASSVGGIAINTT